MNRYHINEAGEPVPCKATIRVCPRGGAEDHFLTHHEGQARAWAEAKLEAQYGVFADDVIEALDSYQSGSYRFINGHLRGERSGPDFIYSANTARNVARLDALFTQFEEVSPPVVYRLVRTGEHYLPRQLSPGEVIEEPSYLSTSDDERFAGRYLDKGFNTRMTILLPETTPCVRPSRHTEMYADETEVLLPRGSRLTVVSDSWEGGQRQIVLRMEEDLR